MVFSRVVRLVVTLMGSVALGFGTIFQPKSHDDDHWSTLPQVTISCELPGDESADPAREPASRARVLAA